MTAQDLKSRCKVGQEQRFSLAAVTLAAALLLISRPALAQVSPAEILNPDLKAAETKYLTQLKTLNREIAATKFPFSLVLSRYVGLDPAQQVETDSRGLEFVRFHDRIVLKITGNYNAAYNGDLLTQNQRAARTLRDVIVPVLKLTTALLPPDVTCDAIGLEISYHARTPNRSYDYEGKEILVVLFDPPDAFEFAQAESVTEQQEILNRSEIYVNGAPFGLALDERDPLSVEALPRSTFRAPAEPSPAAASIGMGRLSVVSPNLVPGYKKSGTDAAATTTKPESHSSGDESAAHPVAPPPQADLDALQEKYQTQLDALAKEGVAKFHFVDYAPPSFGVFQNQIVLQMTLRDTLHFDAENTSIYKRAARSFDLFLAPQLKDILDKVPPDAAFDSYDFSVVNQLAAEPHAASEAVEFIFPRKLVRQFVNAEITNQQLIDHSTVLVNGVRIALNLQLVE
ncbi:MAG: hypothetical protein ACRD50_03000 [Candidatus Acidiferrales bacterium]